MIENFERSRLGLLIGGLVAISGVYLLLVLAVGAGGLVLIIAGLALLALDRVMPPAERVLRWIVRGASVVAIVLGAAVLLIG